MFIHFLTLTYLITFFFFVLFHRKWSMIRIMSRDYLLQSLFGSVDGSGDDASVLRGFFVGLKIFMKKGPLCQERSIYLHLKTKQAILWFRAAKSKKIHVERKKSSRRHDHSLKSKKKTTSPTHIVLRQP